MALPSYFTTSLLPSGNRLVTESFCPGIVLSSSSSSITSSPLRQLQTVETETISHLLGNSADGSGIVPHLLGTDNSNNSNNVGNIKWLIGTPSSASLDDVLLDLQTEGGGLGGDDEGGGPPPGGMPPPNNSSTEGGEGGPLVGSAYCPKPDREARQSCTPDDLPVACGICQYPSACVAEAAGYIQEEECKVLSVAYDTMGGEEEGAGGGSNTNGIMMGDSPPAQWWILMDNGDQYGLSWNNNNNIKTGGENNSTATATTTMWEWTSTDSSDRPLVIVANNKSRRDNNDDDNNNATSRSDEGKVSYTPLEQPPQTSPFSSAVPTPNGGYLLVEKTTDDGNKYQLTQLSSDKMEDVTHESLRSFKDPLPDSMISYSSTNNMWALYTESTDVYGHAVLGDGIEGGALTLLKWNDKTQSVEHYATTKLIETEDGSEAETVFEGLGPIWADVDGDGKDDLITTISNAAVGARLRVYSLLDDDDDDDDDDDASSSLVILAQADPINLGGRWLHQLAVGPLGPNGEIEIVEIRTPHIGGIVRYYQLEKLMDGQKSHHHLKLVASTSRYTSHAIRSRNLDQAVVGDFNGDGIPELVVQNQKKDALVGIQRASNNNNNNNDGTTEIVWSIPLSSPVESNIAVRCSSSGELGGIMEIMFSTQNHQLVKARFAPPEDGEIDYQPTVERRSSGSARPTTSGGASARYYLFQSLVFLGWYLSSLMLH